MTLPRRRPLLLLVTLLVLSASLGYAQWRRRNSEGPIYYTEGGDMVDSRTVKTAREIASHSTGTPEWKNPPDFAQDTFTFVRIIRDRDPYGSPSAGSWITDFPDSDLNLSFRLQQMTSIKVNPDGRVLRLTDPELLRYPFIYMVEPGALLLRDEGGRDPAPLSAPWRFSHGRRFLGRVAVGRVRRADEARLPGSRLRGAADEPRNLSLRLRSRHGEE